MRFRKQRGFVYPLVAAGDELASPPLEGIAHAQASLGVPSAIRFALTPAPVCFEAIARALYRRRENRLVRRERWSLPERGLTSTPTADRLENQIFQSSRRYLYHAVIGAIALAAKQSRRARFEDVYQLLLPLRNDVRIAVYQACADTPDLDQTTEFFRTELPHDLQLAGSATAERLGAPRNKASGLTGVPPLRRFFNHTSDVAIADIVDRARHPHRRRQHGRDRRREQQGVHARVLRMLHTQLQRQVRRPGEERPRVALLADEAHYLASAENVVDQIATHRAAGLDFTFGLQYLAQLGSASEHEDKIRKGVVNLLQSRFLFRLGDHQDAEEAVRIAMAVYSTMIRRSRLARPPARESASSVEPPPSCRSPSCRRRSRTARR